MNCSDTVNRVTKEQLLRPVKNIVPKDTNGCLNFCRLINEKRALENITNEARFTGSGIINLHNKYVYADKNLHAVKIDNF